MNTNVKIFIGFVAGTTIGAVTALLLAPSTGKTARKNLNKKAKKLVKQLERFAGKESNGKKRGTSVSSPSKNGKATAAAR